jgi:hypothetical protein
MRISKSTTAAAPYNDTQTHTCISAAGSNKKTALRLARDMFSSLRGAHKNNGVTFRTFIVVFCFLSLGLLTPIRTDSLDMPLSRGDPSARPRTTYLLVFAALVANVAPTCWSIDGFEESDRLVCDPHADVSNCCSPSEICYSNGLCGGVQEAHNNTLATPFFIGACTRQDFEDPKCAVAPKCRRNNSELAPPQTTASMLRQY